jgi:hypothetical protein
VRALDPGDDLDDRSLGRRSAARKIQASPLVGSQVAEAQHADRDARCERAEPSRARHFDPRRCHPADLVRENAPVECGQPHASGPPARQEDGGREHEGAALANSERGRSEQRCDERDSKSTHLLRERRGETHAERGGQEMWSGDPAEDAQRSTSFLSSARRAGPIPGTASSSSTDEKAPCSFR